ncbi:MAG: UDP-glucose 4-epimerase GalE [Clostridiales bacterium]|nr:UDP-glucose 4-epimerase GalE [Clostridiales bacterium]
MKVLVTGGAGYIGSHTCLELLRQGHDIVVADSLYNAKPEALKRIRELSKRDFQFYEIDIRNEAELERVFAEHAFDCVIHFAGLKAVGESVGLPLKYYDNNVGSTITLCRVMKNNKVKRIIFSSSATVYRPGVLMPVDETAELGCSSPYGWTKFMCEQILRDVVTAYPDWSVVLLRYFNPIGADPSGRIGEDPTGIPNNLLPFVTQTALGRHDKLQIFGNDYATHDGTGVRDYIHVADLADGHVAALQFVMNHKGCEAINLGTGIGYSVLDIVNTFEEVNKVKVPYVISPRRPGDVDAVYAKPDKAKKLLGWEAKRTLDDMCRDSWHWQSNNPQGYQEG